MIGILLLTSACSIATSPPPIPQDPELQAQQHNDTLVWNRRTLGDAYEKISQKDPRWDKAARNAFNIAARFYADDGEPRLTEADVCAAMKFAIDAGCTDPSIQYLYVRYRPREEFASREEYYRRHMAAIQSLTRSSYPASCRAQAFLAVGKVLKGEGAMSAMERAELEQSINAALALMPDVVAEGKGRDAEKLWLELAGGAIDNQMTLNGGEFDAAFKKVDTELAKVPDLEASRLVIKGCYLVHLAWKPLRESKTYPNEYTAEDRKNFEGRMAEARQVLVAGWDAQPGSETAATWMLWVEHAIGRDRDEMEKWFERAMKANPANREACRLKLAWLDPYWRGSTEAVLEFGRQCRDTKNWRAGITLALAEAHMYQVLHLQRKNQAATEYLKQPGVWEEIRAVNDEYLGHFPREDNVRTRYACMCTLAENYTEAHRQFTRLGDKAAPQRDFDAEWIKKAKETAAENVSVDELIRTTEAAATFNLSYALRPQLPRYFEVTWNYHSSRGTWLTNRDIP